MARNTSDPNSPLAQAEITGTGFWPSSGDSMAPTPPQTSYITTGSKSMPNYPESDQQQTSGLGANDSQIETSRTSSTARPKSSGLYRITRRKIRLSRRT